MNTAKLFYTGMIFAIMATLVSSISAAQETPDVASDIDAGQLENDSTEDNSGAETVQVAVPESGNATSSQDTSDVMPSADAVGDDAAESTESGDAAAETDDPAVKPTATASPVSAEPSLVVKSPPAVESSPVAKSTPKPKPGRATPRKHLWLLGGGVSYGFIYPRKVNDYLKNWVDTQGDYTVVQEGDTDMVLSFVPNISVSYAPLEYIEIEGFVEAAWAPKVIEVVNGESDVFHFLRLSPGLNVMGHIPFNRYENSIYFGPGVEVDRMRFEEFRATSVGIRGTAGVRFYVSKVAADVFAAFLYTKADSDDVDGASLELSYTSVMLGATIYAYLHGK